MGGVPSIPSMSLESDLEAGAAPLAHVPALPLSLLSSSSPTSLPRLRVLVLGDSGAGKTSLVARITGRSADDVRRGIGIQTTIGCATECKLHRYRPAGGMGHGAGFGAGHLHGMHGDSIHFGSSLQQRSPASHASSGPSSVSQLVWVELWDMSGHRKFEPSRSLFFRSLHAVILVFDLMNRKSYDNVRRWIKEMVRADRERGGIEERSGYESHDDSSSALRGGHSPQPSPLLGPSPSPSPSLSGSSPLSSAALVSSLGQLPILLIGCKLDEYRQRKEEQGVYESVKDYGLDSIYLSAVDPKEDFSALDRFFDRIVQRRMQRAEGHGRSAAATAAAAAHAADSASFYGTSAYAHAAPTLNSSVAALLHSENGSTGTHSRRQAAFARAPPFSAASSLPFSLSESVAHRRSSHTDWNAHSTPTHSAYSSPSQLRPRSGGYIHSPMIRSGGDSLAPPLFVPPPIRSLADFTMDAPADASPGGAAIAPSGNAHGDPSSLWHVGGGGRSTLASLTGASGALPANTALHALTQQSAAAGVGHAHQPNTTW